MGRLRQPPDGPGHVLGHRKGNDCPGHGHGQPLPDPAQGHGADLRRYPAGIQLKLKAPDDLAAHNHRARHLQALKSPAGLQLARLQGSGYEGVAELVLMSHGLCGGIGQQPSLGVKDLNLRRPICLQKQFGIGIQGIHVKEIKRGGQSLFQRGGQNLAPLLQLLVQGGPVALNLQRRGQPHQGDNQGHHA